VPVATIGLQVGLARFVDNGLRELIIGAVLAQSVVTAIAVLVVLLKDGREILRAGAWKGIGPMVREYRVYPSYMTAYSLMATIRDRFVYFLIGDYSTKAAAGYFGLAQRFINVPNRLASSALRPVYFQRSATVGFKNIENEVYLLLFLITAAVIPAWIVVVLHADNLFALAFGEPWRSAGDYGILLSIPAIPLLIGNWLDRGYDALGKQRVAFWLEMIFSGLSVGALCVCVFGYGDVQNGIVAQVSVLTAYYWIWLWMLLRLGGYSMARFWQLVGLYVGQSLFCLGIGCLVKNSLPWLGAVVVSLGVLYAPVAFVAYRKKGMVLQVLKKT
jgi:O-antigen/teichoic acid export membrane protein